MKASLIQKTYDIRLGARDNLEKHMSTFTNASPLKAAIGVTNFAFNGRGGTLSIIPIFIASTSFAATLSIISSKII
jgi:hypothetical protein